MRCCDDGHRCCQVLAFGGALIKRPGVITNFYSNSAGDCYLLPGRCGCSRMGALLEDVV